MAGMKDKLTGKAKQLEGKLTGDKARQAQGEDRENLGQAKAKTKGAANRVKRATRELTD